MTRLLSSMSLSARFALCLIVGYLIVAILAPWLAPFPQTTVVGAPFEPWGGRFLLGTDNLGRDMLSRMMFGARNTIGLAILISTLGFTLGVSLGLLSGVAGGLTDFVLARLVDLVMSIPPLISALLVLSVLGVGLPTLIGTVAVLDASKVFRLSRALTQGVKTMDFVEVAILRGERIAWIMGREVLPNIVAPLIAEFGVRFCYVFLFISSLSFLGLGLQPPAADWGSMVRENASLIIFGDPTPLLPALALAILAISVNFVVDWLLRSSAGAPR